MPENATQGRAGRLQIVVFGGFQILTPEQANLAPHSAKARALMAMLALAPDLKRGRNWLRDHLWSRQEHEQGSASLRQALSVIRKSLGPYQSVLISKQGLLSLDPKRVVVLPRGETGAGISNAANQTQLLEGLEINDPEFEQWLHQQRLAFAGEPVDPPQAKREPVQGKAIKFLYHRSENGTAGMDAFSEIVKDCISKSVAESGSVEIHPVKGAEKGNNPQHNRTDIVLQSSVFENGDTTNVRIRLESAFDGRTLWSGFRMLNAGDVPGFDTIPFQKLMNQAVDVAIREYSALAQDKAPQNLPAILCFDAVRKMFRLGKDNVDAADELLQRAYDIDPKAIYLSWRAYLRIILLGERLTNDKQGVIAEAEALSRRALEDDPSNSMVLALASYVQTMLFRNYETAFELALESLDNCRINPLAWAFMGIARMHLGQTERGHNNALHARNISGSGPHKYQIDMLACQTAAVSGRFEDAIKFGESTRALAPGYAPPLRYLSALMVNAGRREQAEDVLIDLRKLEPDFSFDLMLETAYPSAALRKSRLTKGLREQLNSRR